MTRAMRWLVPLSVVPVLALLAYGFTTNPRDIPSPLVGRPAAPFTLGNPDFRTRAFQVKTVLRWEYRPGSTLFLVWTESRGGFFPFDPTFDAGRDLGDLLLYRRDRPTNVLLLKVNYWLTLR